MKSITGFNNILNSFLTSSLFKISKHCCANDSFINRVERIYQEKYGIIFIFYINLDFLMRLIKV